MKISEIKAGYLLDFGKDGKGIVNYNNLGQLAVSTGDVWCNVEDIPDYYKNVEVYGAVCNTYLHSTDTIHRKFLGVICETIEFQVGDEVEIISTLGNETSTSVFKIGYKGIITQKHECDERMVKLDKKDMGWVNVEDIIHVTDC